MSAVVGPAAVSLDENTTFAAELRHHHVQLRDRFLLPRRLHHVQFRGDDFQAQHDWATTTADFESGVIDIYYVRWAALCSPSDRLRFVCSGVCLRISKCFVL